MKEQWIDNLRSQMSNHSVEAPKGLLDDIRKEMVARGIAPTPKPKHSGPSGGQILAGSAVVVAVVASAYMLWNSSKKKDAQPSSSARTEIEQKSAHEEKAPDTQSVENTPATTAPEGSLAANVPTDNNDLYVPYPDVPFKAPEESTADHTAMPDNMQGEDVPSQPSEPSEPTPSAPQEQPSEPSNPTPSEPQEQPSQPANDPAPYVPKREMPKKSTSFPGFPISFASGFNGLGANNPVVTQRTVTLPSKEINIGGNAGTAEVDDDKSMIDGDLHSDMSETKPSNGTLAASRAGFPMADEGNIGAGVGNTGIETTTVRHSKPINLGFTFGIPISSKMSLITGVTYNYLSSDITVESPLIHSKGEQKLYYVGIPLAVNYSFFSWKGLNVYGIAGGAVEKLAHGKLSGTSTDDEGKTTSFSQTIKESRPQFSLNGSLGVSYSFFGGFSVYAEPGVSYYFDNGSDVQNFYKDKKTAFNLNMGLRYNLFKK